MVGARSGSGDGGGPSDAIDQVVVVDSSLSSRSD